MIRALWAWAAGAALRVLVVALPVAAGLFRVWVHTDAVQMGYALSVEERCHAQARARVTALELELAAARSPARLMALGRTLGLAPAAPSALRFTAAPPRRLAQAGTGPDARP